MYELSLINQKLPSTEVKIIGIIWYKNKVLGFL